MRILILLSLAMAGVAMATDPTTSHTPNGAGNDRPPTEAHQANPSLPTWAPAAMREAENSAMPGRVVARAPLMSLFLPENWRTDDVVTTEVGPDEAASLHELAQSGLVIDLVDGKKRERLVTFFRAPLKTYREMSNAGKGIGRIVLTDSEYAYVAVRGDKGKSRRFRQLRGDVEDVVATLAIYDERREQLGRPLPAGSHFTGKLSDGSPLSLELASDGTLAMTWGGPNGRTAKGHWLQRDSQILMQLFDVEPKPQGPVYMQFDGDSLIVTMWDTLIFGERGIQLLPAR